MVGHLEGYWFAERISAAIGEVQGLQGGRNEWKGQDPGYLLPNLAKVSS